MSPPILSITDNIAKGASVPSLMPCRIQHDGPIDQAATYWTPCTTKGRITRRDTSRYEQQLVLTSRHPGPAKESYFRGKKLKGMKFSLPEEYQGLVLQPTPEDQTMSKGINSAVPPKNKEAEESTKSCSLQILSRFQGIIVWRQDHSGSDSPDLYTRSLDEWLKTANKASTICSSMSDDTAADCSRSTHPSAPPRDEALLTNADSAGNEDALCLKLNRGSEPARFFNISGAYRRGISIRYYKQLARVRQG